MNTMVKRKRGRMVCCRMNEAEFHKFDQLAREAGIPKEVYIRNLLNDMDALVKNYKETHEDWL